MFSFLLINLVLANPVFQDYQDQTASSIFQVKNFQMFYFPPGPTSQSMPQFEGYFSQEIELSKFVVTIEEQNGKVSSYSGPGGYYVPEQLSAFALWITIDVSMITNYKGTFYLYSGNEVVFSYPFSFAVWPNIV
ncbi:hypothetical protein SteCoe_13066 [Stentor coeruleus]|uniref:Uncharacterized protein n=1 Tax=Stentor coeruleus TaxID=5963 RepID=A0A1R2C9E3_9CILI|nr:hypothetical protein SteCoe_13066 [Stentor coeruleus]